MNKVSSTLKLVPGPERTLSEVVDVAGTASAAAVEISTPTAATAEIKTFLDMVIIVIPLKYCGWSN